MATVLVTGGAGFIGSQLTLELQRQFPSATLVVVDAFRKGDSDAAVAAMVSHMRPAADARGLTDVIVNLPKNLLAS